MDIEKGDIFKDIQEVWVAAISTEVFGEISRIRGYVEAKLVEECNPQFEDKWTECGSGKTTKIRFVYSRKLSCKRP